MLQKAHRHRALSFLSLYPPRRSTLRPTMSPSPELKFETLQVGARRTLLRASPASHTGL